MLLLIDLPRVYKSFVLNANNPNVIFFLPYSDKDGVDDSHDNCQRSPNSAQLDTDGDGLGKDKKLGS